MSLYYCDICKVYYSSQKKNVMCKYCGAAPNEEIKESYMRFERLGTESEI